jgi:hypothetical protein
VKNVLTGRFVYDFLIGLVVDKTNGTRATTRGVFTGITPLGVCGGVSERAEGFWILFLPQLWLLSSKDSESKSIQQVNRSTLTEKRNRRLINIIK